MEGELTGAAQDIARSYEDWFISYAQGPDVSREEAERLAPTARRRLDYEPGGGVAGMIVGRGHFTLGPYMRFVYSGPAGFGREHREIGFGVTGRWQF